MIQVATLLHIAKILLIVLGSSFVLFCVITCLAACQVSGRISRMEEAEELRREIEAARANGKDSVTDIH